MLLLLTIAPTYGNACKKKKQQFTVQHSMTVEEEQRFLYYFYEMVRLHEKGDYFNTFNMLTFCRDLNPYDPIVNQYLGDIMLNLKKTEEAIRFYEVSLQADSTNTELFPAMKYAYWMAGDLKNCLRIHQMEERQSGLTEENTLGKYRIYLDLDDYKNALKTLDQYLQFDPYNINIILTRVELLEKSGFDFNTMSEAYEQALKLLPDNPTLLNNYAYLLAKNKKDLQRAEQMSSKAMQAYPDNVSFIDTYAWILFLKGEHQLAKMILQRRVIDQLEKNNIAIPDEIAEHYNKIVNTINKENGKTSPTKEKKRKKTT